MPNMYRDLWNMIMKLLILSVRLFILMIGQMRIIFNCLTGNEILIIIIYLQIVITINCNFFLQILKTKGKVGYCFDWSVGNNWFVTSVYLIAIIIKLLVLCKERCKYSYCYEATDCNITHIIKLKHTCIFGEVSRFCQE